MAPLDSRYTPVGFNWISVQVCGGWAQFKGCFLVCTPGLDDAGRHDPSDPLCLSELVPIEDVDDRSEVDDDNQDPEEGDCQLQFLHDKF